MSVIKKLVDLELKEAGYTVDYQYIMNNPNEDGLEWYEKYNWKNIEDYERFKTKAEQLIKKEVDDKIIENTRVDFNWFDSIWGLSNYYLEFVKNEIDAKKEKWNKKNKSQPNRKEKREEVTK